MSINLKTQLRYSYRVLRSKLSVVQQQQLSLKICELIQQWEPYSAFKHLAIYQAHEGEVDLTTLISSSSSLGKNFYFPKITANNNLVFLQLEHSTKLKKNKFGILEPDASVCTAFPIEKLDIIFTPLVAFDNQGTRLGMGGGYYDRTLSQIQTPKIVGAAYEFQHSNSLPKDTWDVSLSAVITEKKIYEFGK